MRRRRGSAALVFFLTLLSCACPPAVRGAPGAFVPDGLHERWDLERYRLARSPEEPTGSILPLPSAHGPSRGWLPREAGLHMVALDVPNRSAVEESDGLALSGGLRGGVTGAADIAWTGSFVSGAAGRLVLGEGDDSPLQITEANLAWRTGGIELLLGRAPSFWGDGSEGSILLGRGAPPLDMLRLRTVRPVAAIPGAGGLGRLHGALFLALLHDEDRTIPDPLLHGIRLEWEPSSFLRIGASRTILFGGEGRTSRFRPRDIFDILMGRNENLVVGRDHRDSDQKASVHGEIRLPAAAHEWSWLSGPRLFVEYAGEDHFAGLLPTAVAHHQGGSVGLFGWVLLIESAELVDDSYDWYTHLVYGRDAYRYEGFLLGHPAGTDGRSVHVRLWTPERTAFRAQAYWKRRGFDPEDETLEAKSRIAGAGFLRPLGRAARVEAFIEAASVEDDGGETRTDWRLSAQVQWLPFH